VSRNPRVTLAYPPHEHIINQGRRFLTAIPLGVAYLAAQLRLRGAQVTVFDHSIGERTVRDEAAQIIDSDPDVVGLSVTSPSAAHTRELIVELREGGLSSGIPVAVGGPHIGADPESSRLLGADALFRGESEYLFAEYCLDPIVGGFHGFGLVEDLDSLPHPARDLFTGERYRFRQLMASRGCPFDCIYCCGCRIPYRKRSLENIRGEVECLAGGGHCLVGFSDDVFTLDRGYALRLAQLMREYRLPWSCTTRADLVDEELIGCLGECGCRHISFGVESGSKRVRYGLGKRIPDESYLHAFRWCRDAGIETRAYVMVGLPGETGQDIQRSFDFISALDPDDVFYSPTVVYPGTKLMGLAVAQQIVRPDAWSRYILGEACLPMYTPKGLNRENIAGLCVRESERFYLSPKQILRRMRQASCLDDITDSLTAAAAYLMGSRTQ
jgi:anaerobic magnesium-protoporphyrin IX monomethyl ester cyclase